MLKGVGVEDPSGESPLTQSALLHMICQGALLIDFLSCSHDSAAVDEVKRKAPSDRGHPSASRFHCRLAITTLLLILRIGLASTLWS